MKDALTAYSKNQTPTILTNLNHDEIAVVFRKFATSLGFPDREVSTVTGANKKLVYVAWVCYRGAV